MAFLGLLAALGSCNKDVEVDNTTPPVEGANFKLELLASRKLTVREPSGLSWDLKKKNFITVSDNTNKAYVIDTSGNTLGELDYKGDDTEGVTVDTENKHYWIAEEGKSDLVECDSTGNELGRYHLELNVSSHNKGLEGLSYDPASKTFFVLNEDKPGLLIKWTVSKGIISKKQLNFAGDYSGIFYDGQLDKLWIVSDQSQKLFLCDLDANPEQEFTLGYGKAEGVTVDVAGRRAYIVSDSEETLFIYKLSKL